MVRPKATLSFRVYVENGLRLRELQIVGMPNAFFESLPVMWLTKVEVSNNMTPYVGISWDS
jgi:hypothetical protein